jgi:hypothetical protein
MKKIDISDWKEFLLSDLFFVSGTTTSSFYDLETMYGLGRYPYITTRATNNGVSGFYNKKTENGNVLTVDSAVSGFVSYQAYDFSASDHVEKLTPKFKMTKNIALFIKTIIAFKNHKYDYGRKFNQARIKNTKLLLPVTKNGSVDWGYMENFIKKLLPKIKFNNISTKNKLNNKLVNSKSWKEFKLNKLFNYQHGSRLETINRVDGDIPLITAGYLNTGVKEFITNSKMKVFKNAITIDMFGNCFYRDYKFYADDNIYVLNKPQKLSKYVSLFITTILRQNQYKHRFGRQYRKKHFDNQTIKLPVKDNKPDWYYMENFIKNLPYGDLL